MSTLEDNELSHYGVKGMKWGRRAGAGGSGGSVGPSRKELRGMNKAARARQRDEAKKKLNDNDAEILEARANRKQTVAAIKEARKTYKNDKRQIGRVAAREIMNKNNEKRYESLNKALEPTQKQQRDQMVAEITTSVAKLAFAAVMASAAKR